MVCIGLRPIVYTDPVNTELKQTVKTLAVEQLATLISWLEQRLMGLLQFYVLLLLL